jgi:hypothetical protein
MNHNGHETQCGGATGRVPAFNSRSSHGTSRLCELNFHQWDGIACDLNRADDEEYIVRLVWQAITHGRNMSRSMLCPATAIIFNRTSTRLVG